MKTLKLLVSLLLVSGMACAMEHDDSWKKKAEQEKKSSIPTLTQLCAKPVLQLQQSNKQLRTTLPEECQEIIAREKIANHPLYQFMLNNLDILGIPSKKLANIKGVIYDLAMNKQGTLLAVANREKIYLWDMQDMQNIKFLFELPQGMRVSAIEFAENKHGNEELISYAWDTTGHCTHVWDMQTGKMITHKPGIERLHCYTTTVQGKKLTTKSGLYAIKKINGSQVKMYNNATNKKTTCQANTVINVITLSENGILGCGNYGEVILWDLKTGKQIKSLGADLPSEDKTQPFFSLTFAPNNTIVAGTLRGKIYQWNLSVPPLQPTLELVELFDHIESARKKQLAYQLNTEEIKLFTQLPKAVQKMLAPYVQFVDKDLK